MKALSTFILAITLFGCSSVATGQQKLDQFSFKGKKLNYTVILPQNYDATKTYPVLIGPSDANTIEDESFYWQGVDDTEGWILIGYRIYNAVNRADEIMALLDHLRETYKVEGNKFHTVCFSANSASIFELVMTIPDYFAGITGMAGNPNYRDEEKLKNLKGVKVQFVVGDKDTYWMNSAKKSHEKLKELGIDSQIEIIKDGKHVMTPLIGKGFLTRANALR
ncbi:hypothetical protein [Fulvivirga lutimaris]|uniref:hypothetical protein n=1 Tax=Fulvivirga lutimaris TaxID=1819566 RepID=UPI0012BBB6D3|nr:hypothetical protein [Fulvivirga lutimaris]MTI39851.1 hypothetical protein [Fulvivirga lutimaris]